jgi:hypothetical protein
MYTRPFRVREIHNILDARYPKKMRVGNPATPHRGHV